LRDVVSAGDAARNEDLFRDVNDRIQRLAADMLVDDLAQYVCECVDLRCLSQIRATQDEYAEIRRSPVLFLVAPGHVDESYERVVISTDRYEVVEKLGAAAAVAQQLNA
jgi:hypothetical protein